MSELTNRVCSGDHHALAQAITKIENREPGYRELVSSLFREAEGADIIGITGPPGVGKSTLVDRLVPTYRDNNDTVGVLAIDPASPFTGGAVLGDRIRFQSANDDLEVFVRSMSARGAQGGLAAATDDAITALEAFGADVVIIETVGAGQNEVDVVRTADTVTVVLQPGAGDDIQALKAGLLEIADVFAVNKADLNGVDRLVTELTNLLAHEASEWHPSIVETVGTTGSGIEDLRAAIDDHGGYLDESGQREVAERRRIESTVYSRLQEDIEALLDQEIEGRTDIDAMIDRIQDRQIDPYEAADDLLDPIAECFEKQEPQPSQAQADNER